MLKTHIRTAALLALVSSLLLVPTPTYANSVAGTTNCTGKGSIVPRVTHFPHYRLDVTVKKSGPPTSPTWGTTFPTNGSISPEATETKAFVSPYAEGRWSAYSPKNGTTASASCTRRTAPTGATVQVAKLGNKSCASGGAVVKADGFGDIWVSWKPTASSSYRNRAYFPRDSTSLLVKLNQLFTRDASVFDVQIHVYRNGAKGTPSQWLQSKGLSCKKLA